MFRRLIIHQSQTNTNSVDSDQPSVDATFHPSRRHFSSQSTPLFIPVDATFHPSRRHFSAKPCSDRAWTTVRADLCRSQTDPLFSV